ncbi:MAG: hypothetical protein RB191_04500, partial [Terriglobia bacterium]|nr:hypothetical protein [Terriglobia bacterium]
SARLACPWSCASNSFLRRSSEYGRAISAHVADHRLPLLYTIRQNALEVARARLASEINTVELWLKQAINFMKFIGLIISLVLERRATSRISEDKGQRTLVIRRSGLGAAG